MLICCTVLFSKFSIFIETCHEGVLLALLQDIYCDRKEKKFRYTAWNKSNYSIKMGHGEKRLLKDKGEEQPNRSYYKRHVSNLHFIFGCNRGEVSKLCA
jgi:hypothetical protein